MHTVYFIVYNFDTITKYIYDRIELHAELKLCYKILTYEIETFYAIKNSFS